MPGREADSGPGPDGPLAKFVIRCEEIFFALVIGALVLSGLFPIITRYFGFSGASWPAPLSHQLVLWIALFGAGAATRDRKHITVDAVSQFLTKRGRIGLRALTELFSAAVCGILVPVSVAFVRGEAEFLGDAPSPLWVPESWLPGVIPLGFSILTVRMLLAAWFDAKAALKRPEKEGKA